MIGRSAARRTIVCGALLLILSVAELRAAGEWQAADAPLRYKLDLGPYPTLARIYENCMRLEPFTAAHPRNQPDYEG